MYIFDIYCDSYLLPDSLENQKFIAVIVLILAAKSEDLESTLPPIQNLLKIIDLTSYLKVDLRFENQYDKESIAGAHKKFSQLYLQLEFIVFETLKFNVIRPTICSFLDIFSNMVVLQEDFSYLVSNGHMEFSCYGDLKCEASKIISEFEDVCLRNLNFVNTNPSILAASIIASTRKLLKLPNWSDEMIKMTRYNSNDLRDNVIELIDKRMKIVFDFNNKTENHDSGIDLSSRIEDSDDYQSITDDDDESMESNSKKQKIV
jgi:hypothetical protein